MFRAFRSTAMLAGLLALSCFAPTSFIRAQNFTDIKPSPQQVEWQDLEFGVIIHFGTNTFLDREWGDGTASPQIFDPTQFDPDQWMRAIKAAGAEYVVLGSQASRRFLSVADRADRLQREEQSLARTAKVTWCVRSPKRLENAGLKFGVYLSPWDRHEPQYATPPSTTITTWRNWMN